MPRQALPGVRHNERPTVLRSVTTALLGITTFLMIRGKPYIYTSKFSSTKRRVNSAAIAASFRFTSASVLLWIWLCMSITPVNDSGRLPVDTAVGDRRIVVSKPSAVAHRLHGPAQAFKEY